VREQVVFALDSCLEAVGMASIVRAVVAPLDGNSTDGRREALLWLVHHKEQLSEAALSVDLRDMGRSLVGCINDRSSEVRKLAEEITEVLLPCVGMQPLLERVEQLKPVQRENVRAALLRCRQLREWPAREWPAIRGNPDMALPAAKSSPSFQEVLERECVSLAAQAAHQKSQVSDEATSCQARARLQKGPPAEKVVIAERRGGVQLEIDVGGWGAGDGKKKGARKWQPRPRPTREEAIQMMDRPTALDKLPQKTEILEKTEVLPPWEELQCPEEKPYRMEDYMDRALQSEMEKAMAQSPSESPQAEQYDIEADLEYEPSRYKDDGACVDATVVLKDKQGTQGGRHGVAKASKAKNAIDEIAKKREDRRLQFAEELQRRKEGAVEPGAQKQQNVPAAKGSRARGGSKARSAIYEIARKREERRQQQAEAKQRIQEEIEEHGDHEGRFFRRLVEDWRHNNGYQAGLSRGVRLSRPGQLKEGRSMAREMYVCVRKRPLSDSELGQLAHDVVSGLPNGDRTLTRTHDLDPDPNPMII